MIPVAIDKVFCWLHEASGSTGVIVCPGVCRDFRHAYRAMYALADLLSRNGYPTLRLHYANTGNSADDLDKPLFETWQHNIVDAIEWMQMSAGVERVVLCGFQLGGLLAAGISDPRIAAMILVEPAASGKQWLREIRALSACQGIRSDDPTRHFPNEDLTFRPIDLRSFKAQTMPQEFGRPVERLILASASGMVLLRGHASPSGWDDRTTWRRSSLHETAIAPSEDAVTPVDDFQAILAWLRSKVEPCRDARLPVPSVPAVLSGEDWCEQAVALPTTPVVRGVICRPKDGYPTTDTAVVIGNLARDPQFGVGRLHVELARRLASSGISVLRIDYLGLGDSDDLPGEEKPLIYATPRNFEFRAAVDWLAARGFRNIGLAGHCSGAYHAFRATQRDPRVRFAVLINLLKLQWRFKGRYEGYVRSWRWYVDAAMWLVDKLLGYVPLATFSRRRLRDIADRGTRLCFITGADDHARSDVDNLFGRPGIGTAASRLIRRVMVPGADHLLATTEMRRRMIDAAMAEVCQGVTDLAPPDMSTPVVPFCAMTSEGARDQQPEASPAYLRPTG